MKILNIIFSDAVGGESSIFQEIAAHYNTTNLIIYNGDTNQFTEKISYPIRLSLNILVRINKEVGTFLSSIVSTFTLTKAYLKKFDLIILNSSSLAIPKVNNSIVIVYTPPRALTDRSEAVKRYLRATNRVGLTMFVIGSRILNGLYKMSLQNSKELFCISKNVKDRLLKYYRVEAKVRYLFIDASKFRFESFGKYFLCVSRINEGKRQHLALEAFKLFHQKNKNFKLVIAGAIDGNDRSRRYYENLVKEAIGYPVDFVISPMNEDIKNLYANCYSVLFTAENEDLGLVPLESMASSKPVIAINEGGQKETIVNEVTGFLVGDVLEMVGKMIYLAENLERTQEMGTNGRKHVEREFSKTTFFENLDPIIRTHSKL